MAMTVHIDMTAPLVADHGTPQLKEHFLRPALKGTLVLAHALSERAAGTDMAGLGMLARREGDEYIIEGTKGYVCNAFSADAYGVMAKLVGAKSPFDMLLLMVPRNLQGVKVGAPLRPMGNRACDLADVHFDRVRVPVRYRVGAEGMGVVHQVRQFQQERILSACRANSAAAYHLELAIDWCKTRKTFGKALIENQAIKFRLAELMTDLALSQQVTYSALASWASGQDHAALSAMSKLRSSRIARRVADAFLQFSGASGYVDTSTAARFYRDSRLFSIATGADEIMLMSIARKLDLGVRQ
jgi:citronellyl-CoA dehydrogenase